MTEAQKVFMRLGLMVGAVNRTARAHHDGRGAGAADRRGRDGRALRRETGRAFRRACLGALRDREAQAELAEVL